MPTIFIIFGYRFQFYSNDHTPTHVHVVKGRSKAKFNIFPVELVDNKGFKPQEVKLIESIIEEKWKLSPNTGTCFSITTSNVKKEVSYED